MAACAKCGATLAEGATFCGSCGTAVGAASAAPTPGATPSGGAAPGAGSGLAPNVAGALAYLTVIPAIVFLVMEPYNKDKFIKFNAFQCLFLAGGAIAAGICLAILNIIPILGTIIFLLCMPLLWLTTIVLAVISAVKAYGNQKFLIPVLGKLAEQQANK